MFLIHIILACSPFCFICPHHDKHFTLPRAAALFLFLFDIICSFCRSLIINFLLFSIHCFAISLSAAFSAAANSRLRASWCCRLLSIAITSCALRSAFALRLALSFSSRCWTAFSNRASSVFLVFSRCSTACVCVCVCVRACVCVRVLGFEMVG